MIDGPTGVKVGISVAVGVMGVSVATVPEEVEDVVLGLIERLLQRIPRLPVQPVQLDQPLRFQTLHGPPQSLLFQRHIQRFLIAGAGDHAQNAQRRFDGQRARTGRGKSR